MSGSFNIGMISGTSRDGLDVVLADFEEGMPDILLARCLPYPPAIKEGLDALIERGVRPSAEDTQQLDRQLGHFFARACNDLVTDAGLEKKDIQSIGSHGQTVWHEPWGDDPVSVQLGSGHIISNITGIPTVTDFRTADVLAGGEGAPLAPLLHRELFWRTGENLGVLNLGGISNLTLLDTEGNISGLDCGPANCLMDLWIQKNLGEEYDASGAWAQSGVLQPDLLAALLDDPWFQLPPPKSTGLEKFNAQWLEQRLARGDWRPEDVQATLADLTAWTVSAWLPETDRPDEILVCGGGVHNEFLLGRLKHYLGSTAVSSTAERGAHPDWIEASLFAWLARQRVDGQLMNTGPITGASEPVLLGEIHQP